MTKLFDDTSRSLGFLACYFPQGSNHIAPIIELIASRRAETYKKENLTLVALTIRLPP